LRDAAAGSRSADETSNNSENDPVPRCHTRLTPIHARLILGFGVLDLVSGDQCAD
jgi:hypothetical protein